MYCVDSDSSPLPGPVLLCLRDSRRPRTGRCRNRTAWRASVFPVAANRLLRELKFVFPGNRSRKCIPARTGGTTELDWKTGQAVCRCFRLDVLLTRHCSRAGMSETRIDSGCWKPALPGHGRTGTVNPDCPVKSPAQQIQPPSRNSTSPAAHCYPAVSGLDSPAVWSARC